MTSSSLWLMKMMVLPIFFNVRMFSQSCCVSCGVRTAVGSSRMTYSASRISTFRISMRCCSPTVMLPTVCSGFSWMPYVRHVSSM